MSEQDVARTAIAITRWVGSPSSIIIHSVLFLVSFAAAIFGWLSFDRMLLVLTTIVSLEAIYLAIFIQMTLNLTNQAVEEISDDVEEMQEDVAEIQEDVDELQEDVEEMSEDDSEEAQEEARKAEQKKTLTDIQADLRRLMEDIVKLQKNPQ